MDAKGQKSVVEPCLMDMPESELGNTQECIYLFFSFLFRGGIKYLVFWFFCC